jgi:hypothetical protein
MDHPVVAVPVQREDVAGEVHLHGMAAELLGVQDRVQKAREGKGRDGRQKGHSLYVV